MKFIYVVAAFLLLQPLFSTAQVNQLKNNKDVSWVAETTFSYQLEKDQKLFFDDTSQKHRKVTSILKNDAFQMQYNYENLLGHTLVNMINEDAYNEYTSMKGKKISARDAKAMLISTDTIITFYPETFEETTQIVSNKLNPDHISEYLIKQLWWYNEKTHELKAMVTAIAPVVTIKDNKGNFVYSKKLFWINMGKSLKQTTSTDYHQKAIIWACEHMGGIDFSEAIIHKGDTKKVFTNAFIQTPRAGKVKGYSTESRYKKADLLYSKQELNQLFESSRDTVITFDPETYKEDVQVIENKAIDISKINDYRIVQHFYFDKEKGLLTNKVTAIAPLLERRANNAKYYVPIYYLHF